MQVRSDAKHRKWRFDAIEQNYKGQNLSQPFHANDKKQWQHTVVARYEPVGAWALYLEKIVTSNYINHWVVRRLKKTNTLKPHGHRGHSISDQYLPFLTNVTCVALGSHGKSGHSQFQTNIWPS